MTELLITPNYDKKTAKFKGTVAAGETVRVKIVNARDIDIYSLRLRVMEFNGRTLALFERTFPVEEEGAEINWVNDGEHLTCNLDLNTVEMQRAVCGMCERELLVVLDDPENDILHFKSICAFQGWPKMKGKDAPYELGEYPDVVEDLKQRVADAEMSIAASVDEASGIVAQANNVKNIAENAQMNAAGSAANAAAAKNEAAGYAEEAAMSAKGLQTAVKSAEEHKNAAETARDEAEEAKNAAENARDNAETVAEESAQRLVAAEKSRAEMAENEIRGKVATLIASDTDKSARSIAAEEVAKIVTGAPDDLDTLKEIAAYIESDKTGAAAMAAKISENSNEITLLNEGKVDNVPGKGLSTNDYTTAEKDKLAGIEPGAQKNPDLSGYAQKTDLEGFASTEQVKDKRDKTDNIAVVDSVEFTKWKFHCDVPEIQAALEGYSVGGHWSVGYWFIRCPDVSGYMFTSDSWQGAEDAVSLSNDSVYQDQNTGAMVAVTATREKVVITKSEEPYVTPTGVKSLLPTPFHALTPEVADTTVTLAPVDGAANWVDGRVEKVNDVSTMSYAVRGGLYIEVYSEPDYEGDIIVEEFVYFDALEGTIRLDDIYCIEEGYVYELTFTVLEDLELRYEDPNNGRVVGYVPKGAKLFATVFEGNWGENLEGYFICATMVDDAVFTGFEEGGSVNYAEMDDGGTLIQDVTVDLGRRVAVTLPASADAAKARWFSLALETDADSEKEVTWQGGEVIEALPGASKLVPGLNVWDVAEVAPGKFRVERASSPAQSAPLTLTAPGGRVAELTVNDDLVLEVKEV